MRVCVCVRVVTFICVLHNLSYPACTNPYCVSLYTSYTLSSIDCFMYLRVCVCVYLWLHLSVCYTILAILPALTHRPIVTVLVCTHLIHSPVLIALCTCLVWFEVQCKYW